MLNHYRLSIKSLSSEWLIFILNGGRSNNITVSDRYIHISMQMVYISKQMLWEALQTALCVGVLIIVVYLINSHVE